jgi:hypothetical protein
MKWGNGIWVLFPAVALSVACRCAPLATASAPTGEDLGCDRLSPAPSRLTDPDPETARNEAAVSGALLSRVPSGGSANINVPELLVVMVKQNPRATEEAVYILRTAPRPTPTEYEVVHARAKGRLMYGDGSDVGVDFTQARLDSGAVDAVRRAWGPMTLEARWPDRERAIAMMKFGGTIYTFDYQGDNLYGQGYTISPQRGTCADSMVELGDLLSRFADAQDESKRAAIRAQLLARSGVLAKRLRKL